MTQLPPVEPQDGADEVWLEERSLPEERPTLPPPPEPTKLTRPPEEWRPVLGFAAYEVSSTGKVRRVAPHKKKQAFPPGELRPHSKPGGGAPMVKLFREDGWETKRSVHKLVEEAFGPTQQQGVSTSRVDALKQEIRRLEGEREEDLRTWKHEADKAHLQVALRDIWIAKALTELSTWRDRPWVKVLLETVPLRPEEIRAALAAIPPERPDLTAEKVFEEVKEEDFR